jgi:drug/metabolite transporter (DMT)-like permease
MTSSQTTSSRTGPMLSSLTRAVLWMGVALLSFSAIAIAGRESGRLLPTTELIFWRSLIGVVVLGAIYLGKGTAAHSPRTTILPLHSLRACVHFGAQYAWLYALTLIPLAELFALEFTSPLWVALFAPLVLGERLTGWRMTAAAIGFVGALFVVEPGLFSGHLQLTASAGTLYAVAAAMGFAASILLTKRLTRIDPALRILFWMQLLQGLIAAAILIALTVRDGRALFALSAATPLAVWGWILVLGIAGLTAHYGLTRAIGLADAIIVAPMDFLRLPLIATVGALFYAETLRPSVAMGAAIVVLGNAINIWAERRAKLKATSA